VAALGARADRAPRAERGRSERAQVALRQLRLSESQVYRLLRALTGRGLLRTRPRGRGRVPLRELLAEPAQRQLSLFDDAVQNVGCGPLSAVPAGPPAPVPVAASSHVAAADTGRADHPAPVAPAEPCPRTDATMPSHQCDPAVEGAGEKNESPVVGGRADGRAVSISHQLFETAEHVQGVLQRGIDGLTCDEVPRPPSLEAIVAALERHQPSREDAIGIAIEARSVAQAQNRAPNIAALYERRLGQRRCASQQRHRPVASSSAAPRPARCEATR
jgi:hypothetical protein